MARTTNMKSNTRNRILVFFQTLFATKIRRDIWRHLSSMVYTRHYGTVGAFIRWIHGLINRRESWMRLRAKFPLVFIPKNVDHRSPPRRIANEFWKECDSPRGEITRRDEWKFFHPSYLFLFRFVNVALRAFVDGKGDEVCCKRRKEKRNRRLVFRGIEFR